MSKWKRLGVDDAVADADAVDEERRSSVGDGSDDAGESALALISAPAPATT